MRIENKGVCIFCGKEYYYNEVYATRVAKNGWDLEYEFVKIEGKCDCVKDLKVKRMCLNCEYYNLGRCENKEVLKEIKERNSSELFEIQEITEVKIKKETSRCKKHKPNLEVINRIFE